MKTVPAQQPWDINATSAIRCEFFLSPASRGSFNRILVVRCAGLYRTGSQGAPDATYMEAMTAAALIATCPNGLIFDFTKLDYQWGDNLESVYHVGKNLPYPGANLPFALVLGEHCREAVISLAHPNAILQEPEEWMFDTFEEAWHYVDERIHRQRSSHANQNRQDNPEARNR